MTTRIRPPRPPRKSPITVVSIELAGCEPIDLDAWAADYVALAMELQGMRPPAGAPPVRTVG